MRWIVVISVISLLLGLLFNPYDGLLRRRKQGPIPPDRFYHGHQEDLR